MFSEINKSCPFHNHRTAPPPANKDIERAIYAVKHDLQRLVECTILRTSKTNTTKRERDAINQLRQTENVTGRKRDKAGEITVLHTD